MRKATDEYVSDVIIQEEENESLLLQKDDIIQLYIHLI
jgi:hypothetical protein